MLLVERVRFPCTTISTHFFRGGGLVAVLERLAILDDVLALGCPPLRREWSFGFGRPGPDEGPPQTPADVGFSLSVRRGPLDDLLLRRARQTDGVDVAQPVTVRSLLFAGGRVVGARLRDREREYGVRSRIVVGADGRHSLVAREVAAPAEREAEPLRTLYYRYVPGWRGPRGEPRAAFATFRAGPDAELDRRIGAHPGLAARWAATAPAGRPAGGPPEPNWMRTPAEPGWVLVGDAAVHQDPWTGAGMDTAGRHAVFAADAIAAWLGGTAAEEDAFARYRQARDDHVLTDWQECTSLARDLSQLAEV